MTSVEEKILSIIYRFFTRSKDFNGIPLTKLANEAEIGYDELLPLIEEMVKRGEVSVQADINPHIIAVAHYPLERQLEYLTEAKKNKTLVVSEVKVLARKKSNARNIQFVTQSHLMCAYPTPDALKKKRDVRKFSTLPFGKMLALGLPQLTPVYFKMDVLERYLHDPRYKLDFGDFSGDISIHSQEGHNVLPEDDKVFLKTFGLGHDKEGNRVIVALVRYLHDMPEEHQMFWKTKQITDRECFMVAAFYDTVFGGKWAKGQSVFSAFIHEQRFINQLVQEIQSKPLFKQIFDKDKRPREFNFFGLPTLANYEQFISLLDKMMNDNLNKPFFKGLVEFTYTKAGKGTVKGTNKGTLAMLEEWFTSNYHGPDTEVIRKVFQPFKDLRAERQKPAHRISENYYDPTFHKKQRDMMVAVYQSIKCLRIMLHRHPYAQHLSLPHDLEEGKVMNY